MRRTLILLALLCCATQAFGQGGIATVTIPTNDGVATALTQCESLRLSMGAHAADWSVSICASMLTRVGVEIGVSRDLGTTRSNTINACSSAANVVFTEGLANFRNVEWPIPFTPNTCGDSQVFDTEQCDDGSESATCNVNCTTSVCGDGILNVTAGEQCDDGELDPGDGCDATCQIE